MAIKKLYLQNFRNIEEAYLELGKNFTLVHGDNGSGKSSVLESLYLLGFGRSFRSSSLGKLIQFEKDHLSIGASLAAEQGGLDFPVGYRRQKNGNTDVTISRKKAPSVTHIAKIFPVQILTPDTFYQLMTVPKLRRRFFDWGVFHVKHDFVHEWKGFNRLLSHRSQLLKSQSQYDKYLSVWDKQFATSAEKVTQQRSEYFAAFEKRVGDYLQRFGLHQEVTLTFRSGWSDTDKESLLSQLQENFETDYRQGFSGKGPHRFDLILKSNGKLVADSLSRGQLKLLFYVLMVAQIIEVSERTQQRVTLLIDDFTAELDQSNQELIVNVLKTLVDYTQLVITMLDDSILSLLNEWKLVDDKVKVFHVKHGKLTDVTQPIIKER
ncbi:MAG: DNA replication/repair protein RecF [Pseudomonadota bacterium]